MTFLFILLGSVAGAMIYGLWGGYGYTVVGGIVGYFLAKLVRAHRRIDEIEQSLAELRERIQRGTAERPIVAPEAPATPDITATVEDIAPREPPGPPPPEVEDLIRPQPAHPPETPSTSFAGAEDRPRVGASAPVDRPEWREAIENAVRSFLTSGSLVVKIGVVVLFIGVAFLLKYAAEHQYLPMEVRLIGVSLGGTALMLTGWRLRHRRLNYALALEGGGVAVLYLTVFAAMRLYDLVPPVLAFALLVALGVLSAFLAVAQQSQSLAILSVAGGFMAPILTSTGRGSHVVLFGYYALLDAGILGMAWFRAWRCVNLVGFLFTFGIGMSWGYRFYRPEYFSTVEPFLIIFFVFYVAVAVLYAMRQPPELRGYIDGTLVFGCPLIAFGLQVATIKDFEYGVAWSALALGLFYTGTAWLLFLKGHKSMRTLSEAFLAMGVAFGTLAIPLAFDNRWSAAAWALEGSAMVWVGVRQRRLLARAAGMLLQFGAGLLFLHEARPVVQGLPILNGHYLACLSISISGLFASFHLYRHEAEIRPWEAALGVALAVWGLLWWLGAGLHEIDLRSSRNIRMCLVILFLSFSCLACDLLARRLVWRLLDYPALGLLPALWCVSAVLFSEGAHPFSQTAFLAWPPAFAASYYVLWKQEGNRPNALGFLHAAGLWLLTVVVAWELSWRVAQWVRGSGDWSLIAWGAVPALTVLLISKAGQTSFWPIGRHYRTYLTLGAGPIVPVMWAWALGCNFLSPGDTRPLIYLPVLNPLDVAIGFVFIALVAWLLRLRATDESAFLLRKSRWVIALYAASIFAWLNGILVRTIHHWGGVGFTPHAIFSSPLFQEAISIFWTVTALFIMVFATRRKMRTVWFVGGGLLAVVVVKLFLVDLSKTGTIERIVTFIVVGLLLLVVGYFSPVPPRFDKDTEARQS